MTGNIQQDAQTVMTRMSADGYVGEELLQFAEFYALDQELNHEAVLLSMSFSLAQSDPRALVAQSKALLEKILDDYDSEKGQQKAHVMAEIEANALKKYEEVLATRTTLVELKDVGKNFKSSRFHLQNINLSLNLGEITGIIGPNANGKSTLLKIIVGELLKDEGTLEYPQFSKGNITSWAAIKRKIAYIPQDLIPWKGSLREVLLYEAARHGIKGKDCELQVDFIIQRLGLSEYIDHEWNQLSGGYKLRFELAKALVWRPSFMVLDEPLANLDVAAQLTILNDLKNLAHSFKNPICVIITSQHIHEIEHVADNLLVLETGKIVYFGKPFEFNPNNRMYIAELSCPDAGIQEIRNALQPLQARVEDRGYCLLIEIPHQHTLGKALQILLQQGIEVAYFRDITHSVKQIFYGHN